MPWNIINNLEEVIFYDDLNEDDIILDVRTIMKYQMGHIDGSINISVDVLRTRIDKLNQYKDQTVNVMCAVGLRAHVASMILRNLGFKVRNISGGYHTYITKHN